MRREGDTVVAALLESLFRRSPSPEEEQRGLWEILESLHPQNSMMLADILQQVRLHSTIDPDGQPLRRGCDPGVAASVESIFRLIPSPEDQRELYQVLERIHPADARTFLENLLPFDVEYYDEVDCCSDVLCGIDPDYVSNEIDFLHELHEPYFCVFFVSFAPTDGELSHAMNDLANYDPGSGKIPPESGSVTAMSDFASDSDSESGGPSLPWGVHSDMADLDDIDSVSQLLECVGFGDLGLPCLSGKIPPESGSPMAVSDFGSEVDSESGGPSLPTGVHSDMTYFDDIDGASQMKECVGFGDRGWPCLSRKIPRSPGM